VALKASRFNIVIGHPNGKDTILYNSLYGSITLLNSAEAGAAKRLLAGAGSSGDAESDVAETLREQKHVVDESVDEMSMLRNRKMLGIKDSNRLDLIIMPTLECNFSCVYCYETRRPGRMDEAAEAALGRFLALQIPRFKFAMLHWFGGEPLICYEKVLSLTRLSKNIAQRSGSLCTVHVTTNGFLLNRRRIQELIAEGVLGYQITLDGPEETHDALRMLTNGKGTFARIFDNIVTLARAHPKVLISLRINFNHSNLHAIPRLLESFPRDVRPQLAVVYEPIFGSCALGAMENLAAGDISAATAEYYALARDLGYIAVHGVAGAQSGRLVYCYAERENQLVIDHKGNVYKCSVVDFDPRERVGYIGENGELVKEADEWDKWVGEDMFERECLSCVYLPLCMGGCRKMRLKRKGTGSYCTLVPTNTSYILKQVCLGGFEKAIGSGVELQR
jgi:uncharacterized protein